eukprot:306223_1
MNDNELLEFLHDLHNLLQTMKQSNRELITSKITEKINSSLTNIRELKLYLNINEFNVPWEELLDPLFNNNKGNIYDRDEEKYHALYQTSVNIVVDVFYKISGFNKKRFY